MRRTKILVSLLLISLSAAWIALCRAQPDIVHIAYDRVLIPHVFLRAAAFMGRFEYSFAESVAVVVVAIGAVGFLSSILLAVRIRRCSPLMATSRMALYVFSILFTFYAFTWVPLYARAYPSQRADLSREALIDELCSRAETAFNRLTGAQTDVSAIQNAFLEYMDISPPQVKPLRAGAFYYRLGITGVYSPFTFEAFVNTLEYDRVLPFTIAHEMAHAIGYAREDDANLIAYAVCCASPDPTLNYAAALSALNYAAQDAYLYSQNEYKRILSNLPLDIAPDFFAIHVPPATTPSLLTGVQAAFLTLSGQPEGLSAYRRFLNAIA